MIGCLSWGQLCRPLSAKKGKGSRDGRRSWSKATGANASAQKEWSSWVCRDLLEATSCFSQQSALVAQKVQALDAVLPLVNSACQIVESMLTGMTERLSGVQMEIEVRACQCYPSHQAPDQDKEVTSLEVNFLNSTPLVGEIATRSRIALSGLIERRLRFGLLLPLGRPMEQPVQLWVEGLEMLTLPDVVCARTQLRAEVGRGLNPLTAYDWWERNRHTRFPLNTSKFHRIMESLLEQHHMKMLGRQIAADTFWGYVHTTDLRIQAFNFHFDKRMRGGITVTLDVHPPKTPAEAADAMQARDTMKQLLESNRAAANRMAPSGINVAAMLAGPSVGQPGACPKVIAKLLSPAQWWGPGEGSWHRADESWLCTDKRDLLGRVIKENGRIIWRKHGETEDGTSKGGAFPSSEDMSVETTGGKLGRSSGNLVLMVLILLLASILYSSS